MPPRQKPNKTALARLGRLERRPDLVIEGGLRPLGIYVREKGQTLQPQVALWLDAQSGFIRGTRVVEPGAPAGESASEALDALVESLITPVVAPSGPPPPTIHLPGGAVAPPRLTAPPAALPARIRVNDAALAAAARAIFDPLGVAVEQASEMPAFDAAFQEMSLALGANPDPDAGPPEPFSWQIDPALLPPLYAAASRYARRAPWDYMPDHPPLAVTLGEAGPQPGVETLYASIMGGGGQVTGIAFYYSLDDFQQVLQRGAEMEPPVYDDAEIDAAITMLRQAGAPIDGLPPDEMREAVAAFLDMTNGGEGQTVEEQIHEHSLVFFLEDRDETDPTYIDWLKERGLKVSRNNVPFFLRTVPGATPHPPNERETRALTLAIDLIERFFKQFGQQLQTGLIPLTGYALAENMVDTGAVREVRFPPAGYDWTADLAGELAGYGDEDDAIEEPEESAPAGSETTLYRFQVKLAWLQSVWRRIELRGDQTLHDLHMAIQEAFDWDDDHLYAFFLSGKAWDSDSEYESPYGGEGRNAARYRLASLPLRRGKQFLYIFDFGDELRHQIKLEAITPRGVDANATYPRIVERHGESVPQYGDEEDDADYDDEEEE